jgi:sporadic carbohydrate cluster protein (TIGR04323 family)
MNLKGYNSTKVPVPLKVQNLVIRDYCARNAHTLLLPNTEFIMPGTFMILKDFTKIACDGIVAYSMFLAPREEWEALGREVHFALENYVYPRDIEECNIIWALRRD